MKIALAQLNYTVGDIEGNSAKIMSAILRAKSEGVDLVVFAEQAISGVPAFDLLRKTTFLEMCEDALVHIASICDGIDVLVGLPILTDNGTVSAAAHISNRRVLKYIGKREISARREMGFLVGCETGCRPIIVKGHKFLVVVGDDIRSAMSVERDVEMIISVNARKYGKGVMSYRYEVCRNISFVENTAVMLVNQVCGASDIVYDGSSGVFSSKGELMIMCKNFEEDYQVYDTESTVAGLTHPPFNSYNDRNTMIYKAICLGLKDFFFKNGYKKACVGLSGGIDSAVVTAMAVASLGAENVLAMIMPSQFSSDTSVEDAIQLAENLGIEYQVVPITQTYNTLIDTLKPAIGDGEFDLTEENIQARIRTIMLMAIQNKRGYVMLNSSNKSENALGLCTLYGDTAGAFSITGDLYKGEVYDLARFINKVSNDVIPETILEKEPSSELHPGQKDTDILPPYEVVDAILYRMIDKGEHREEIINAGFDSDVVEKIHSMIMRNEKKRYQYPPVLRLSLCTFGHERLMPLTNKYGD